MESKSNVINKVIREQDVIPEEQRTSGSKLNNRTASRAAVFIDEQGRVALIHVRNKNHYKLPGGGLEETGEQVEIGEKIVTSVEYISRLKLKQVSHALIARRKGQRQETRFTRDEKAEGMEVEWHPIHEALDLLENSKPTDYRAKFIVARDHAFLLHAFELIA